MTEENVKNFDNYPKAHFFLSDGSGHIIRSRLIPEISKREVPSTFTIVPIGYDNNPLQLDALCDTYTKFIKFFANNSDEWQHVAIMGEKGKFISNRKEGIGITSFVKYCEDLDEPEMFSIKYHEDDGSFSIRSNDGTYLHHSMSRVSTVKIDDDTDVIARWIIHPVNLRVANDEEQLFFAGFIRFDQEIKSGIFEAKWESDNTWQVQRNSIAKQLIENLQIGEATRFQHERTEHWWFSQKLSEDQVSLVVSSRRYPAYLAGNCAAELADIYEKYKSQKVLARIEKYGLQKRKIIETELAALVEAYRVQHTRFALLSKKQENIIEIMQQNIEITFDNIEKADELYEKAIELKEQCDIFRKDASDLNRLSTRSIFAIGIVGLTVGGAIGFAVGGPGGALLISEPLEIVIGSIIGLSSLSAIANSNIAFWTKLVKPSISFE